MHVKERETKSKFHEKKIHEDKKVRTNNLKSNPTFVIQFSLKGSFKQYNWALKQHIMSYAYLFKYIIIGDTGKFIIVFFILLRELPPLASYRDFSFPKFIFQPPAQDKTSMIAFY